ncbi:MAG TPA: hypothetical protein VGP16_15380 [Asanoa sp.]|nr:hypothetical protein [Asanoa sp.]
MRGRIMVAAAAVLVLLGGCSIGDIRRPPPPKPTGTTASPEATRAAFEVRHADVPVPPGFQLQSVEFVDQALGYALFGRCGSGTAAPGPAETCSAQVVRTEDGGRSWHQIFQPEGNAKGFDLYADRARLVLYVEPGEYYVSTDRGVTYERSTKITDAVRATMGGEYQVCCDQDAKVVRFGVDGTARPTRGQPDVPGLLVAASAVHWVFAVGLEKGRPIASVSNDQGDTWRQVAVGGASGQVQAAQIEVDHGGGFAWLIGQTDLISWPALWFFNGTGMYPVSATGHPDRFTSAVSLEDGSLAVTTPDRPGVVAGGVFQPVDWPIDDCYLRLLADGTLFCSAGAVNWLGVGSKTRKWIRVLVGNE